MIFGQVHWGKFPRKRRVSHDINIADSLYSMGSALFVLDFTRERLIIVCEGRGISCLHGNSQDIKLIKCIFFLLDQLAVQVAALQPASSLVD